MSVKINLKATYKFLVANRRSGTSTLLKEIANENKVWVLVQNEELKEAFGYSGLNIRRINESDGYESRPILVDNFTLLELIKYSLNEIERLEESIRKRDTLIKRFSNEIGNFEIEIRNEQRYE